jgi:acyl dehydratase
VRAARTSAFEYKSDTTSSDTSTLHSGLELPPYRVLARNFATASENRIHADDVARQHGFSGGLVPGVTTYGYSIKPVIDALGPPFLERGRAGIRLLAPVYEGDPLVARATVSQADAETVSLGLRVSREADDAVCAVGNASLAKERPRAPDLSSYPRRDLPARAPEATRSALERISVLGSLEVAFDALAELPVEIHDDMSFYREHGIAHPVLLLGLANFALASNVVLGPWIHCASEVESYDLVRTGDFLSVRGRVAKLYEKKGREFVELDVLYVVGHTRAVARVRHTAIYRL